ncbi:hypothetical protein VaNZ11_000252 [Volvox africanus]|uniref:Uncharacterized protein n=1 Tax=Volvox africanus TaxID=51714 RepID=A0ABQ5RLL0_9CHLO|nr:hypothetical protein VaNZ11_000252 [Volvox africanus]
MCHDGAAAGSPYPATGHKVAEPLGLIHLDVGNEDDGSGGDVETPGGKGESPGAGSGGLPTGGDVSPVAVDKLQRVGPGGRVYTPVAQFHDVQEQVVETTGRRC